MPKHRIIYKRKQSDPADLWAAYQQTRSIADRNRLVEFYIKIGFVRAIALRLNMAGTGREYGFDADDLESFGWQGLIRAVERFDPGRGFAFRTYAGQKIVGAMLDGVRDEGDPRPRLVRDRRARITAIVEAFTAEHGRKPTDDELRTLVAKPGMTEVEVDCILRDGVRDDQRLPIEVCETTGDTVPLRLLCPYTARELKRIEDRDEIDRCLDGMEDAMRETGVDNYGQRGVVLAAHIDGLTLRDVAKVFGICASRASQINNQAINIMRAFVSAARKAQAA